MATVTAVTQAIFEWKARPCVVVGESTQQRPRIGGKPMGTYQALQLRFLDGQEPPQGLVGKVTWGKQAKRLRGAIAQVWARTDELIQDGLNARNAKQQAMAELAKGVL